MQIMVSNEVSLLSAQEQLFDTGDAHGSFAVNEILTPHELKRIDLHHFASFD